MNDADRNLDSYEARARHELRNISRRSYEHFQTFFRRELEQPSTLTPIHSNPGFLLGSLYLLLRFLRHRAECNADPLPTVPHHVTFLSRCSSRSAWLFSAPSGTRIF